MQVGGGSLRLRTIQMQMQGRRRPGAEFSVARLRSEGKEWGAARSASAPGFRRLRYEHKRVKESSAPFTRTRYSCGNRAVDR